MLAVSFFSPLSNAHMCEILGKEIIQGKIVPLSGLDFVKYLEKTKHLPEAMRYSGRIKELLTQLADADVLSELGTGKHILFGGHYSFGRELTTIERHGILWLALALGPEFIWHMYSEVTFQITGIDKKSDVCAGTGIVVAPHFLLTCAHVMKDAQIDEKQIFGGQEYKVQRQLSHDLIDVGLIEVTPQLTTLPGLAFRDPAITETVYTLGYPRIPLSRNPAMVMHRGEITNEGFTTLFGADLFLYSAISRPGNSGGPVIAANGNVVGIVSEQLSEETTDKRMPFHAGVRTSEIAKAIAELEPSIELPIEDYE
jgi:hypothetical protein